MNCYQQLVLESIAVENKYKYKISARQLLYKWDPNACWGLSHVILFVPHENLRNCYRERITHPQSHKWADTELGPPPVVTGPSPHSSSGKDASQTPLLAPRPQRCLSGEVFQTPPRASLIHMETDGKSSTTVELRAHLQTPVPRSKVKCWHFLPM